MKTSESHFSVARRHQHVASKSSWVTASRWEMVTVAVSQWLKWCHGKTSILVTLLPPPDRHYKPHCYFSHPTCPLESSPSTGLPQILISITAFICRPSSVHALLVRCCSLRTQSPAYTPSHAAATRLIFLSEVAQLAATYCIRGNECFNLLHSGVRVTYTE